MSRKKVIVLGVGRGQIPLINLLHKYNCFVIGISPKGNYPGIDLVDEIIYCDVKDKDVVLRWAVEKGIQAIVTDQLDAGVLTAAYVSEKMGLKSIGFEVAKKFTDKYTMRKEAENIGCCIPKNICVSHKKDLGQKSKCLHYPLIIKPVDSSASRGIYKVNTEEELLAKFEDSISYSRSGKVIVEEFIVGKEYVVDAYTHDYKTTNLVVGHRDYFNIENTFIPRATIFLDANTADNDIQNRIKELNIKLVQGMGLQFGITHAEYLYNQEEDKIYLVEIAARGGGVFISSDLIPLACGLNANELLVRDILGLEIEEKNLVLTKGASAYFCYLVPKGEIISIKGTENIEKIKNVEKAFFDNIEIGMKTGSVRDKSSRKGPILIKANSVDACYKVADQIKKELEIEIQTDTGIEFPIWE